MLRVLRIVPPISAALLLTACWQTAPKITSEADMEKVLKEMRTALVNSTVAEEDSKLGVRVSKITTVFKVTAVDSKTGKLTLGIVEPVGNFEAGATSQNTRENTVTIEFTRPGEPATDKPPQTNTAGAGQAPPSPRPGPRVPDCPPGKRPGEVGWLCQPAPTK